MVGISYYTTTSDGESYIVKREIREDRFKRPPNIDILRQWFHCDVVLRNQGVLYFCNRIESVEFEEVVEKKKKKNKKKVK